MRLDSSPEYRCESTNCQSVRPFCILRAVNSNAENGPHRSDGALGLVSFLFVAFLSYHMSVAKFTTLKHLPVFDPKDDTGIFYTENAFHYRYAKMAAAGVGIPAVDWKMQYPEGMHVLRDETPMMERFAGFCWRRLPHPAVPFHVYLMWLACFYSSATLFPIFLLGGWLWRNPLAGVVASLFYALTYPFIGGVVLASYVRQDFVLPFLFLGTFLFVAAADTGRRSLAAGAGLLLAFSFASWHMAQFYYSVLFAGLIVAYFAAKDARGSIAAAAATAMAAMIPVSLLFQSLRASLFVLSPPLLAGYALLAQHVLWRSLQTPFWKRLAGWVAFLALFAALALLVAHDHYARYSHVYTLIFDKIRFFNVKPDNPALLGFESRVMWTSSFVSPSFREMFAWLGMAWIAAAAGVWIALGQLRARPLRAAGLVALWMLAVFVVLFAMIWRMDVFAAFFVCLFAGGACPREARSRQGMTAIAVLLALVSVGYWQVSRRAMATDAAPPGQTRPVIDFLRNKTGENDVVLALFQFSPVICAYADRPVIVHSKFENRRVREKVEEFYTSLFKSEKDFYGFCRTYGARYFVYEPSMLLDRSGGSLRYMADRLTLAPDAVVLQFQFAPQSLAHFQLVFQDDFYRIYRVLDENEKPAPAGFANSYPWDSRAFRKEELQVR